MRAKITLLGRVILRVDEDCVVRASGHARLASDADRLVEIDDAVGPLEHRGRRARRDTRCMRTLITTRYLVCASRLRKRADVDVFYVGASYRNRHNVFRFAGRGARLT